MTFQIDINVFVIYSWNRHFGRIHILFLVSAFRLRKMTLLFEKKNTHKLTQTCSVNDECDKSPYPPHPPPPSPSCVEISGVGGKQYLRFPLLTVLLNLFIIIVQYSVFHSWFLLMSVCFFFYKSNIACTCILYHDIFVSFNFFYLRDLYNLHFLLF